MRLPQLSPLFPYTTLFRSERISRASTLVTRGTSRSRNVTAFRSAASFSFAGPIRSQWKGALTGRRKARRDRKSTRLNSSHLGISYAVFCLKKKKKTEETQQKQQGDKNIKEGQRRTIPQTRVKAQAKIDTNQCEQRGSSEKRMRMQ